MIKVVAAAIWEKDKFLICQRPKNKKNPMLWEFAGGKVEPGESEEKALIRECQEELSIQIEIDQKVGDVNYQYPDFDIHLILYNAHIVKGTPTLLEHNALAWIEFSEISNYNFCPADIEILQKLLKNDFN